MTIKLYMLVPHTEALGPGKRFAIWVQGCNKRCKGCIAPEAWDVNGGYEKDVAELAEEIINTSDIEGITISGGEPFLQQEALCDLIKLVQSQRDLSIIIYTGMLYEEVAETELASLCDIIIDGEYVEELNDNKSLRGSSNQKVICLTDRYKSIMDKHYEIVGRKIEFTVTDGSVTMVGIPPISINPLVSNSFDFEPCDIQKYERLKKEKVFSAPFWKEYENDSFYEIATLNDLPIALINYEYNDDYLVIKLFEVNKTERDKDYGKKVIKQFLDDKKMTAYTIPLWNVVGFWERCGFIGDQIGMWKKYEV